MLHQKQCFKCEEIKSIDEFYKHKQMGDGYLNKCKECTKKDVKNVRKNRFDYYKNYDKQRNSLPHRVKARRDYAQTERGKEVTRKSHEKYYKKCPEKHIARIILNNAVRDGKIMKPLTCKCGNTGRIEAHHEDYNKPLDVVWLCVPCHRSLHKVF